jgi:hypothetical protein
MQARVDFLEVARELALFFVAVTPLPIEDERAPTPFAAGCPGVRPWYSIWWLASLVFSLSAAWAGGNYWRQGQFCDAVACPLQQSDLVLAQRQKIERFFVWQQVEMVADNFLLPDSVGKWVKGEKLRRTKNRQLISWLEPGFPPGKESLGGLPRRYEVSIGKVANRRSGRAEQVSRALLILPDCSSWSVVDRQKNRDAGRLIGLYELLDCSR